MRKQNWKTVVLSLLPATMKEINENPCVRAMNKEHREQRVEKGSWPKPVNCMAYDTLYRLRQKGIVERSQTGVYRLK